MTPTFKAVADRGLLVSFGVTISDDIHAQVLALDRSLSEAPIEGVVETVPALVNVMVSFDAISTTTHGPGLL